MSASAVDFTFDMTNVGTQNVSVQVNVLQLGNDLRFTVDQSDTDISFADLQGVLFHINEAIIDIADLDFTFVSAVENITGNAITPPITPDVSLNTGNFQGLKDYDVLVQFGSMGIGNNGDDIKSIMFDVSLLSGGFLDLFTFMPVNMDKFMAVRFTSVWSQSDPTRQGSGKGECCGTTIPEPSSTMGLLAFAVGGLLWRRRLTS
ncbi:MAG: hypothetical protein COB49_03520 [Alphaproteobacteria bacterium]|nr:MAG: hypothetical protein COB49_03520 [Alphaproteobacteria bacterium]